MARPLCSDLDEGFLEQGARQKKWDCMDTVKTEVTADVPVDCVQSGWGAWSTCTAICGGGTRSRTLSCVNQVNGETVANSLCTGTQPALTGDCNTQVCPSAWWTGEYSACTKSCGGGLAARAVECREVDTQNTVADSRCSGTKPSASQPSACRRARCQRCTETASRNARCEPASA